MTVSARVNSELTVEEILDDNAESLGSNYNEVRHTGFNLNTEEMDASSPVNAKEVAGFVKTLSGGAGSIDLTALAGTNGATVNGTDLKVKAIKFVADEDNDEVITISEGSVDGYELLGDGWTLELPAGGDMLLFLGNSAPTIATDAKVIDLASADLTAELKVIVLLGDVPAE